MTIANNYAPVVTAANGVTTVFTGSWNAITAANLVVYLLNTTTGVYTLVTQGLGASQYQVTSLNTSGFVITFNTAPVSGNNVIISRSTPAAQTIPYTTSRGFEGPVEEGSFDALTAMMQENNYGNSLSIQGALGDTTNMVLTTAALRANRMLAFDASGNVIISNLTLAQIESGSTSASASAAAAAASATAASGSATSAAASAVAAANSATGIIGTSTTSNTIGTGSKSFTASTGKQWAAGQYIIVSQNGTPANYFHGTVTSYNSTTGALVMNVTDTGGSGTAASWNISVSGTQGTAGSTGATGPAGLGAFNAITGCLPTAVSGSNTTAAVTVSSGLATNSLNTVNLTSIGYSWAVANGNAINGFQGGSTLPNSSVIHFFLCSGGSGTGVFASASLAPTLPAGYNTSFRRIFSLFTNSSGALVAGTPIEVEGGAMLYWLATQVLDVSSTTLSTTRTAYPLSVPTGIKVRPHIRAMCFTASVSIILTSGDETDVAPIGSNWTTVPGADIANNGSSEFTGAGGQILTTDTSGQINARATGTTTSAFSIVTRGFTDFRRG